MMPAQASGLFGRSLPSSILSYGAQFRVTVARRPNRATELACAAVVAVTTSDRVARFFEHNGFERVSDDEIPEEKWRSYDPARRSRALCLRLAL
jgi:N-acetylglutamate synthase-like GNAT family acetyltransferase